MSKSSDSRRVDELEGKAKRLWCLEADVARAEEGITSGAEAPLLARGERAKAEASAYPEATATAKRRAKTKYRGPLRYGVR
jgi:hypothetical protein